MAKIETLENNRIKLTFEVSAEDFSKELVTVYHTKGKRFSIPGFRKGKLAPKKMIETYYGENVFFEDAFENIYNRLVPEAIRENDLYPAQPELDIQTISKAEGLVFSATFEKNPYLNLGEYKGIELKKSDYTVHKKDVEAETEHHLSHIREDHAREESVDRPVKDGDIVDIDYSGSIDGEKFEGGTAEHQKLTIGSGSFIPGFEDQIIGMKKGEERDIKVTFPEDYGAKELAGKEAVFAIKLHDITEKILPEMDDEFASEVSDFETFEEYRKSIYKEEETKKRKENENKKVNDALLKALENCESFVPDDMIREQAEGMAHDAMARFGAQNMDLETFCQMVGLDPVEFVGQFKENAEKRIKTELMLGKIADAENIEISDEELEKEAKKLVEDYSTENTTEDDKKSMLSMIMEQQRTTFIYQIRLERAQKVIMDNVVTK